MIEENLTFQSDGLGLEARLSYADDLANPSAAVLICSPHPFLGGDMHNNVVSTLTATLAAAGLPVFRFNYRGIGGSEVGRSLQPDQQQFWENSTCPEYESEILVDCENAFAALARQFDATLPFYLIGYSFGTIPTVRLSVSPRVSKLCLISPPLAKWEIETDAIDRTCGIFYAPGDFACPQRLIESMHKALKGARALHSFDGADHFFVGHEDELAQSVLQFLELSDNDIS